jgi:hypothetical protein
MSIHVWTERESDPNHPGWHDCTYCSVLMCLVYAGFTKFPKGVYTAAEREAFESSDDRPDETGASLNDTDVAAKRRYGLTLHQLPDRTKATLKAWLNKPGLAFAIEGTNANLATALRHWDPTFTGGHCVCVVTRGDGKVLWLDPEAPDGYAGDVVDIDTVIAFAYEPTWVRYTVLNEFAPDAMPLFPASQFDRIVNRSTTFAVTSNFRDAPSTDGEKIMQLTEGTAFVPSVVVHGEKLGTDPDADLWYGGWLYNNGVMRWSFGFSHSSCFVRSNGAVVLSPIETVSAPSADLEAKVADLSEEVKAAEAARDAAKQTAAAATAEAAKAQHALDTLSGKVKALFSALDSLRS